MAALSTPTNTLSNIPEKTLFSKAGIGRLALAATKSVAVRQRITDLHKLAISPDPVQFIAFTSAQVAARVSMPETSFCRLIEKHGIIGDVRMGARVGFSLARSSKIEGWIITFQNAAFAAQLIGEGLMQNPREIENTRVLALKLKADAESKLRSILRQNPKTNQTQNA